jgi:hypothetical protein
MLTLVLVLFLATLGASGIIYWALFPESSFLSRVIILFISFLEAVGFLVVITFLARSHGQPRVSGASRAIASTVIGVYAVVGLVTILVYGTVRTTTSGAHPDGKFIAILFAEAIICFIVSAFVLGMDLYAQGKGELQVEARSAHADFAESLGRARAALRNTRVLELPRMQRIEEILKVLTSQQTRLRHAPVSTQQALESDLGPLVGQIEHLAIHLPPDGTGLDEALEALAFACGRLDQGLAELKLT